MKPKTSATLFAAALIIACVVLAPAYEAIVGPTGVLKFNKEKSYGGYTLFSPMMGDQSVYLIDMEGNLVHKWKTDYPAGAYAMLLENGNLLRGGTVKGSPATIGGAGGIVQEIDWDSKVVWEYKLLTPTEVHHHTFCRMPNGNTLILAWESKTVDEFLAKGRDPKSIPPMSLGRGGGGVGKFWVDFVREVDKDGKTVWEYHVWDHIGNGPHQFNINYKLPDTLGPNDSYDYTHFNSVEYMADTDQVVLNSRNFSEFYIINHKTGEMVYRWGNPSAYGQGRAPSWLDNGDQKMFGNHSATPLGQGRFLIFDNGSERAQGNRSAVIEVDTKTNSIVWEYAPRAAQSFYSVRQGACQRLPNGNTLVTSSTSGHLFEVTKDKELVWEYVNPLMGGKEKCLIDDSGGGSNMIHRAYRYGADYPGLKNRDLSKKEPLAKSCPDFSKIYKTTP